MEGGENSLQKINFEVPSLITDGLLVTVMLEMLVGDVRRRGTVLVFGHGIRVLENFDPAAVELVDITEQFVDVAVGPRNALLNGSLLGRGLARLMAADAVLLRNGAIIRGLLLPLSPRILVSFSV